MITYFVVLVRQLQFTDKWLIIFDFIGCNIHHSAVFQFSFHFVRFLPLIILAWRCHEICSADTVVKINHTIKKSDFCAKNLWMSGWRKFKALKNFSSTFSKFYTSQWFILCNMRQFINFWAVMSIEKRTNLYCSKFANSYVTFT